MRWKLGASAVIVLFVSGLDTGRADDNVVLNPGLLGGKILLSSHDVLSNQTYAGASFGTTSGSFSGDSYLLTVEGDWDYTLWTNAYLDTPGQSTRLYIQQATPVFVPVGLDTPVAHDFDYATDDVQAKIDVVGGTVKTINLEARAAQGGETYVCYVYRNQNGGTTAAFPIPMIVDEAVVVRGSVVIDRNGEDVTRPLSAGVDMTVGSAEVAWNFDVANPDPTVGSFEGSIDVDTSALGTVNSNTVQLSGRYGTETQGVNIYESFDPGPFFIDEIPRGDYYVYTNTRFDAPLGSMRWSQPTSIGITGGATVRRDYQGALALVRANPGVSGFFSDADVTYGNLQAEGVGGTPTAGAAAFDDFNGSQAKAFDLPLLEGDWNIYYRYVSFFDGADPLVPLNTNVIVQDYSGRPAYGGTPLSLAAGEVRNVTLDTLQLVETSIPFDVAEAAAADPQIEMTSPQLSGSSPIVDPETGIVVGSSYFNATGSSIAQAKPTLRIVGVPGVYTVTASAVVNGSRVTIARFDFPVPPPIQTPPSEQDAAGNPLPVVVSLDILDSDSPGDLTLTFENVLTGGVSAVTVAEFGPAAPPNFRILGKGKGVAAPLYYNISTTAVFEGSVQVCLDYDDSEFRNADGSQSQQQASAESRIELWHFNETLADYEALPGLVLDTDANRICADTTSFSTFAIFVPLDSDGDGIVDTVDNCPNDPNPDQVDTDGDGVGDVCDGDADDDGVPNGFDNCPDQPNADQQDNDSDGAGDVCDSDDDNDGIEDHADNCPLDANASQQDFDGDGVGDVCDEDADDDGLPRSSDLCPLTELGSATDDEGCSSSQRLERACPVDADYKNHGKYVSCVSAEAETQVEIGLIGDEEEDAIVSAAAQSPIGHQEH